MKIKNILMVDLKIQYKIYKTEIDKAILDVIEQSAFIGGQFVEEFEKRFKEYTASKWAISLNSGTDALYLSLMANKIGVGDEVITTPFTFFATAEVIAKTGATPVFADIDEETLNIDLSQLERSITSKTKAIIPVHLFGKLCNMDELMKIADKHGLLVIEDACQAIGAVNKGKKAGRYGITGCFSFFPSKNLGCYGDGGMVITENEAIGDEVRLLRNHGSKVKYFNDKIGISSRLDGIQAAILTVKLKYIDEWNMKRLEKAKLYNKLLSGVGSIKTPQIISNAGNHVFHQYTIIVKDGKRDELKRILGENGVSSMIYYPVPLHLLSAFKYLKYKPGSFPVTELACQEVLSLPIYPELPEEDIEYITDLIKKYVQR